MFPSSAESRGEDEKQCLSPVIWSIPLERYQKLESHEMYVCTQEEDGDGTL
jgi:hypothetical protein